MTDGLRAAFRAHAAGFANEVEQKQPSLDLCRESSQNGLCKRRTHPGWTAQSGSCGADGGPISAGSRLLELVAGYDARDNDDRLGKDCGVRADPCPGWQIGTQSLVGPASWP